METIESEEQTTQLSIIFEPVQLHARTSKERVYIGRLIKAGYTRNILNEPTDLFVTPEAIQGAVNAGQFEGLACFIDHVSPGNNPSMRNLLGSWHSATYSATKQDAQATLTAYVTDDTRPIIDRLDQMLGSESPAPDVGISLVFYPEWKKSTSGRHV